MSLYANYLLPAIFLNPILFLHSLNTILSRILPPIHVAGALQPPPYSDLGPSACHPHIDLHYSDNLCWSYTIVVVLAQLLAYDRVTQVRSEKRERMERSTKEDEQEEWTDEERERRATAQTSGEGGRDRRMLRNGTITEDRNGGLLKPPDRRAWREESSSEDDSLPPN